MIKSGFCGIGIIGGKFPKNLGTLWRSAFLFGADFLFTIGKRYKHQPTDTLKASRHIPLFHFTDWQDFLNHLPKESHIVFIEQAPHAVSLEEFKHPRSAVYILGAEDTGIPEDLLKTSTVVKVPSLYPFSLNVAVAGSIVLYDRFIKRNGG